MLAGELGATISMDGVGVSKAGEDFSNQGVGNGLGGDGGEGNSFYPLTKGVFTSQDPCCPCLLAFV